jgi:hypothetical protein
MSDPRRLLWFEEGYQPSDNLEKHHWSEWQKRLIAAGHSLILQLRGMSFMTIMYE